MREYMSVNEHEMGLSEVCDLLVDEVERLEKENEVLRCKVVSLYKPAHGSGRVSLVKLADDRGLLIFEDRVLKLGSVLTTEERS